MNRSTGNRDSFLRYACGFELGIGLVGIALGLLFGPSALEYLRFSGGFLSVMSEIGLGVLAAVPTIVGVWLFQKLPWESVQELKRFGEHPAVRRLVRLNHGRLVLLSLCSGIGEELAFRGWLFTWLLDFSPGFASGESFRQASVGALFVAIFISSAVFGAAHPHTRMYVAVTTVIGIYYAGLLVATDSLWIPVFAHATHNGVQFMIAKRELARQITPSFDEPLSLDEEEASDEDAIGSFEQLDLTEQWLRETGFDFNEPNDDRGTEDDDTATEGKDAENNHKID